MSGAGESDPEAGAADEDSPNPPSETLVASSSSRVVYETVHETYVSANCLRFVDRDGGGALRDERRIKATAVAGFVEVRLADGVFERFRQRLSFTETAALIEILASASAEAQAHVGG